MRRVDDRLISGIVQKLRSSGRWADAPVEGGPRKTLSDRFGHWAARGVWRDVFKTRSPAGGPSATLLIDAILDPTDAKAHRCAAGGKEG
jgi:transposase